MPDLTYVTGDATRPVGTDPRIIVHVVNDVGRWGAGFAMAVGKRWPPAEAAFRAWAAGGPSTPYELGRVLFVPVAYRLTVAHLVGQRGLRSARNPTPVRYDAIDRGLARVAEYAAEAGASVHMPRIATGLAGGSWERVEPLVVSRLCRAGVAVTVYDLPEIRRG